MIHQMATFVSLIKLTNQEAYAPQFIQMINKYRRKYVQNLNTPKCSITSQVNGTSFNDA
jgi:hypothetical protein